MFYAGTYLKNLESIFNERPRVNTRKMSGRRVSVCLKISKRILLSDIKNVCILLDGYHVFLHVYIYVYMHVYMVSTSFINIRQSKNTLIQRIKISNIIFIATISDAILAPRGYYLLYQYSYINLSIYTFL